MQAYISIEFYCDWYFTVARREVGVCQLQSRFFSEKIAYFLGYGEKFHLDPQQISLHCNPGSISLKYQCKTAMNVVAQNKINILILIFG